MARYSTTHTAQFFASRMSLVEVLPSRNSSALDLWWRPTTTVQHDRSLALAVAVRIVQVEALAQHEGSTGW